MVKMNFHMGVTLRCYGNVEVEAESIEAAFPLLTADYIGEHIDIKETTTDSGQDLAVIDVTDAETGEELADYGGHSLPSPYDPKPSPMEEAAPEMLAALKAVMRCAAGELERPVTQRAPWPEAERLIGIALAKADGLAANPATHRDPSKRGAPLDKGEGQPDDDAMMEAHLAMKFAGLI